MTPPRTITVAFTGASGLPYGVRLVECLLQAGCRVWLLYSQVAQIVARQEMDWNLPARPAEVEAELSARFTAAPGQLRVFGREEWFAPPASGSNPPDAMVVCPCTVATLASIAGGLSQNLIERAADVVIKEGPFQNYEGSVDEVLPEKGLVRVLVTIFGRQAPIELEYWQIAKAQG